MAHTFHIPVLGLGYSIDTPLKVARYGISSVVSIVDDELIERMRKFHSDKEAVPYTAIGKDREDYRSLRITAYLDLLLELVKRGFAELKQQPFKPGTDLTRYFELQPPGSSLKKKYDRMLQENTTCLKQQLEAELRQEICIGSIDVNIMAKVDKVNYNGTGEALESRYTDALAALRGFANSKLESSLVLSAGLNPRLYSYMESFSCFYPDSSSPKSIILKVSDFRSAMVQAKMLAKKGLWVSEFRIESGLNCGGHAFATDGLLLGPILQEFKQQRTALYNDLLNICETALAAKNIRIQERPAQRLTAQGGIGTAAEHDFLLKHYGLDAAGWGSPFLLVPEVTNVDTDTLTDLAKASEEDFYLSDASPLGVLFNNFRNSSSEKQRLERIRKGRPGSPCTKKYLVNNTEFTPFPVCTASREYQHLKISQLTGLGLSAAEYRKEFDNITAKTCLCEGLCASVYLKNGMLRPKENLSVSICPGPNLVHFSSVYTLDEMAGHIYGKTNLLKDTDRPHMFINELKLYVDYLEKQLSQLRKAGEKQLKYITKFSRQLLEGIAYYRQLLTDENIYFCRFLEHMNEALNQAESRIRESLPEHEDNLLPAT